MRTWRGAFGTTASLADVERIRLCWAPVDLPALRQRLLQLGFAASEVEERDDGQTEFVVTNDDGYSHGFGVPTERAGR